MTAAPEPGPIRRFLSTGMGWIAFQILEIGLLWLLLRALPLERFSFGVARAVAVAILVTAVAVNYWIRRRFLSGSWDIPRR